MDDRFNTIAGWTLFSGVVALGLASVSSHHFRATKENRPEKMGYEIEGVVQPAPAPRFSATPGAIQRRPAGPGEHTAEILRDWGVARG